MKHLAWQRETLQLLLLGLKTGCLLPSFLRLNHLPKSGQKFSVAQLLNPAPSQEWNCCSP